MAMCTKFSEVSAMRLIMLKLQDIWLLDPDKTFICDL